MEIVLKTQTDCIRTDIDTNKLYQYIGNFISNKMNAPDTLEVQTIYGDAKYQLIKKSGAFFVREEYNHINIDDNSNYDPIYLVCVNPEHNNYKFYKLEDCGNGQILATYGRIGASSSEIFGERTHYYPRRMYFIKVLEKLNKGYEDMTSVYLTNATDNDTNKSIKRNKTKKNTVDQQLFDLLQSYSKHVIKTSCISSNITKGMVTESRRLLNEIYAINDNVDKFNEVLLKLLSVSPRKVDKVEYLLATSINDFEKIVSREENLIMSMEALLGTSPENNTNDNDSFKNMGIKVFEATEKQYNEVLSHLNDELKPKVKKVYRVIPEAQKKRFNDYLKKNNIKKVKQFWHGSRNENWLSIINNGLLLKPNAIITGKMFGDGIYFAPGAKKSWGYTSYRNTYWAKGNSDTAFMGLYACAYGKPHDVTASGRYNQNILDSYGCNCVHAHAGPYLYNDEIIFYNEDAMLLNYVVEFH